MVDYKGQINDRAFRKLPFAGGVYGMGGGGGYGARGTGIVAKA